MHDHRAFPTCAPCPEPRYRAWINLRPDGVSPFIVAVDAPSCALLLIVLAALPSARASIRFREDDLDALTAAAGALAAAMGDPERITAVRVDEAPCRAELDFGPRVPSRLH